MRIEKILKSNPITVHSAIAATATSSEIDCRFYNGILLEVSISGTGTWKADIKGSMVSGNSFVDVYDGSTQMTSGNLTTSRIFYFKGVPDYIKVVATEVSDGATCTIKVQPLII